MRLRGYSALLLLLLTACSHSPPPPSAAPTLVARHCPLLALHAASAPIRVPVAALAQEGGLPGVFVLAHGRARFRVVRTGRRTGNSVQILSGLTGNETLVLGNLRALHDGTPIHMHIAQGNPTP